MAVTGELDHDVVEVNSGMASAALGTAAQRP